MSLKENYSSIRVINDKLPTKFLTKENISECDFLFTNLEKIKTNKLQPRITGNAPASELLLEKEV